MSLANLFFDKFIKKQDDKRIATQSAPEGVQEFVDIPYVKDGNRMHLLDVYKPEGAEGKLPVIIDVHGGGWVYGDKELNKMYAMRLAKHGFAVVNLSYRLCPEVDYIGSLQDIFAAFDWIKDNAEEYSLDLDNLFITGDSAGGHYVSLVLRTIEKPRLQKLFGISPSVSFKAAGFTSAVFSPLGMAKIPGAGAVMFNEILGKGYRKTEKGKAAEFFDDLPNNCCPCFLISAYGDFVRKDSDVAYKMLKEKGIECEYVYFDKPLADGNKLAHVYNILQPEWEASKQANKGMCDFFKKHIS